MSKNIHIISGMLGEIKTEFFWGTKSDYSERFSKSMKAQWGQILSGARSRTGPGTDVEKQGMPDFVSKTKNMYKP